MLNHITVMGRLTKDPELRYTGNNTPVASFTVAVERDFSSRDGGEKQTDFIDCVAWRQTGEFISKYFAKGNMIAVSGRLQIRDYNDREGNRRRSAEIVVDNAYFCESKKSRAEQGGSPAPASYHSAPAGYDAAVKSGSAFEELDGDDGELPF